MKFYYIDDSMFHQSNFAQKVFDRFERYIRQYPGSLIFISTSDDTNVQVKYFQQLFSNVRILMSPALFDIDGIRGNLHTTFLSIEGFPSATSYSGSIVVFDTDDMSMMRVYLDMFIQHDNFDMDIIVKELEDILEEKIQSVKKKLIMN